jgi:multidrug efflux pump
MLVVPSLYLLIGGYTKPSTYVGDMIERLRVQTGLRAHGDRDAPTQQPAE